MTWVTGMTWTFWEAQMLKNGQEIAEENDVQKEIWKKKKENVILPVVAWLGLSPCLPLLK